MISDASLVGNSFVISKIAAALLPQLVTFACINALTLETSPLHANSLVAACAIIALPI